LRLRFSPSPERPKTFEPKTPEKDTTSHMELERITNPIAPSIAPSRTSTSVKIIPFTIGVKSFHDGDSISITEVKATSPDLKTGDKVSVKGHYTLASQPKASLCLFQSDKGSGATPIRPEQQISITKGRGDFELSETLESEGYLHVSFYPVPAGEPFGGLYFGTAKQMEKIKH